MKSLPLSISILLSASAPAQINPPVNIKTKDAHLTPTTYHISSKSPADFISAATTECRAKFTAFTYGEIEDHIYFKMISPISSWICVNAGEAMEYGYESTHTGEKAYYNYKNATWHIQTNPHHNKEISPNSMLDLYNITSKNAKGYAVIDSISLPQNPPRKKIHFCMIHKLQALCGDGETIRQEDSTNIDITPQALKLIESIEFE
ncbi:hypothetical protein ACFPTX_12855 [Pseudomonas sp. GCM10022188]|uniref:hypothetical protein n=1 Tax=Pseudomonas TaxID=286 RepID=UPI001E38824A|nr:hypothetical protein [Pseudomonas oryzagri]MCC6075357.1 hypothetical protein [Pseudomonas oryzagri]